MKVRLPLLAPSGPLSIVHSSIIPNGVNNCLTSSSVCCLLSIPTKSFRSDLMHQVSFCFCFHFVQFHFIHTHKHFRYQLYSHSIQYGAHHHHPHHMHCLYIDKLPPINRSFQTFVWFSYYVEITKAKKQHFFIFLFIPCM